MNCEAFRHQLLIDPQSEDPAFRDHLRACTACARAAEEALGFEQSLREALRAELVPESVSAPASRRSEWFTVRTASAFFFLPLLLTAFWLGLRGNATTDDGSLAATVIAHILAEEERLQARGTVAWSSLRELFEALGADLRARLGPVRFAGRCVIGDREGIHLVMAGKRGAVTALFIPGRQPAERSEVRGRGLQGAVLPTGFGSLAVVGEPGEPLEPVALRLLAAVRWERIRQRN